MHCLPVGDATIMLAIPEIWPLGVVRGPAKGISSVAPCKQSAAGILFRRHLNGRKNGLKETAHEKKKWHWGGKWHLNEREEWPQENTEAKVESVKGLDGDIVAEDQHCYLNLLPASPRLPCKRGSVCEALSLANTSFELSTHGCIRIHI